jgi:hypothetical protein
VRHQRRLESARDLTTWRRRSPWREPGTSRRTRPERSSLPCKKHNRVRENRPKRTTTRPSQNGGNGPHPAESLPSAGDDEAAAQTRPCLRILVLRLELSSSRAGRSCLPHITFPPSPTAPIGRAETKLTLPLAPLSLCGFRRWDRGANVAARDSTRDSMIRERERERERVRKRAKCACGNSLSSYSRPERGLILRQSG